MADPNSDTIAAVATPAGFGAIAVLRISGPRAREVGRRVVPGRFWERPGRARHLAPGLARAADGELLDQVLVLDMPGPRSYTGEDVVELQCHGGALVTQDLLRAVTSAGARLAEAGEFTRRAFLNGRIDLTQAEAVADLIAARSDAARRLACRQLAGVLGSEVRRLRAAVVEALAVAEAGLDFPAEELASAELSKTDALGDSLEAVRLAVRSLLHTYDCGHTAYEGTRVALVGKPNVGKSSLLNALVGGDRALVTPVAGTTRDVVEGEVRFAGFRALLADTAGLGAPTAVIDALSMERARAAVDEAAVVVAVFDASAMLGKDDGAVVKAVDGKRVLVAANKKDLGVVMRHSELLDLLPGARIVETSALTGEGVEELRLALGQMISPAGELAQGVIVFHARHQYALATALGALDRGAANLKTMEPREIVAQDLREAADALAEVTGEVVAEEVLDRIFAEFCVGK